MKEIDYFCNYINHSHLKADRLLFDALLSHARRMKEGASDLEKSIEELLYSNGFTPKDLTVKKYLKKRTEMRKLIQFIEVYLNSFRIEMDRIDKQIKE
jgi:hypothetical protein